MGYRRDATPRRDTVAMRQTDARIHSNGTSQRQYLFDSLRPIARRTENLDALMYAKTNAHIYSNAWCTLPKPVAARQV
jgi:hypothetical protein